jgi:hypothetical protein
MSAALGLLLLAQLNPLVGSLSEGNTALTPDSSRLTSFEFRRVPSQVYACEPFEIVVEARDQFGARFYYTGLARLATTIDDNFVYVSPTQVSFLDGRCSTYVIATRAESLQLRCSDPGNLVASLSPMIEVLPGMPRRFLSILPGEALAPGSPTGRLRIPDAHLAGDTFSFDIYITDSCYNVIRFRDDSVVFGSSDRFGRLPAGGRLSDGHGVFETSLRSAGTHRIYTRAGTSSSVRSDTSSLFQILPGGFAQLLLLLPGESPLPGDTETTSWQSPGKTGTALPQYLRTPFPVSVLACDRCWNHVAGAGDSVQLASDFPFQFTPASQTLDDSAVFTVQFDTDGPNQNIRTATVSTGLVSYWSYVDVRSRGARLLAVVADSVRAGETTLVDITVLDANDNAIVATRCDFSITAGHGDMLDRALLTDTLGRCTARFLCTRAHFAEWDTIRVSSGTAETLLSVFIEIPDSAVMKGRLVAYPNPFGNPTSNRTSTMLAYNLPYGSDVTLSIYDPFGNTVLTRSYARTERGARAGINQVYWDGRNSQGRLVASGIYVVQVAAQSHTGITYRAATRVGVVW